jgi:hypothetical protein
MFQIVAWSVRTNRLTAWVGILDGAHRSARSDRSGAVRARVAGWREALMSLDVRPAGRYT